MHKGCYHLTAVALLALIIEPSCGADVDTQRADPVTDFIASTTADDDECDVAGVECSLSLRQLRAGTVSPRAGEAEGEAMVSHGTEALSQLSATQQAIEARRASTASGAAGQDTSLEHALERKGHHHDWGHHHAGGHHHDWGHHDAGGYMVGYHQTSPEICNMILHGGFHPGSAGWCGGGIYFALSPQATEGKAIGTRSHKGCILRATIALGRVKKAGNQCDHLDGPAVKSSGYDSIMFNPGDGEEIVVFDSSRVSNIARVQ